MHSYHTDGQSGWTYNCEAIKIIMYISGYNCEIIRVGQLQIHAKIVFKLCALIAFVNGTFSYFITASADF
jgi:hypothetical protein